MTSDRVPSQVPAFEAAATGGFALTLPPNLTFFELRTVLRGLTENSWLDRQTLAVGIDMTFYNPQTDHVANTQIVTELIRTGYAKVQFSCVAGTEDVL